MATVVGTRSGRRGPHDRRPTSSRRDSRAADPILLDVTALGLGVKRFEPALLRETVQRLIG